MDPELLRQLLAGIGPDPTRHFVQQDATAQPPRQGSPGRGRTILQLFRDMADTFGEQTLGRALTLGTADPRLPETQEAFRQALGFAGDFTPGFGDIKAIAHDAPIAFGEGRPVSGTIAAASALPLFGIPLDILRGLRKADEVGEVLEVEHFGPLVGSIDELDPSRHGTGLRGAERQRQAAFPEEFEDRTFFYVGGREAEPGLRGRPSVRGQFARSDFADPGEFQRFVLQARDELAAEGRPAVPDLLMSRAERLLKESGEFEGFFDPRAGVLVKFTPTELPLGAANREIIEATNEFGGATFSVEEGGFGRNLVGEPLYSVARPTPDGRKDWMTLPPGEELTREHLNEFRDRFADELADPEASIGTWKDESTGRIAIDVVETIGDREEALKRAAERGQDAIFDLETLEEVRVPGGAAAAQAQQRQQNR